MTKHETAVLVTGAAGNVGSHLVAILAEDPTVAKVLAAVRPGEGGARLLPHVASHPTVAIVEVDLTDSGQIASTLAAHSPSLVVHCAAMTNVNECFKNTGAAEATNVVSTAELAKAAAEAGVKAMVYCSTDMVFGGVGPTENEADWFDEVSNPGPLSVYGSSKLRGEEAVLSILGNRAVVARLPLMFGVSHGSLFNSGFFVSQIQSLRGTDPEKRSVNAFFDEWRTPLSYRSAAMCLAALGKKALAESSLDDGQGDTEELNQRRVGGRIFHVAGGSRLSRQDLLIAMRDALHKYVEHAGANDSDNSAAVLAANGYDLELMRKVVVGGNSQSSVKFPEPRPADLSLSTKRYREVIGSECSSLTLQEELQLALQQYFSQLAASESS